MISIKMIVCSFMIACYIICSIICAYTDIRNSKIKNRVLIIFGLISIILNSIYYTFFAKEYIIVYLLNLLALAIFSILFYLFHIWSAGDSKFLIIIMSFMPIKLYAHYIYELNSVITIIIIFSIAFVYLIIESLFLGYKNKNLFTYNANSINLLSFAKQYIKCTFFVLCFNIASNYIAPNFTTFNNHIILIMNMLIVLLVSKSNRLNNGYLLILMLALIITLCFAFNISLFTNYKIILFMLIVVFMSIMCEKYNYNVIKTKDIKENMVLNQLTINSFSKSKINNLPHYTTEDLRSRLNIDEINAIKKWEKTKYGMPYIIIVKKMPFALFISIGCIIFIMFFSLLYYY